MPIEDTNTGDGLAALFVAHANGYMTRRALEERRVQILRYLDAHKYTIKEKEAIELFHELDEIAEALDE